MSGAVSVLQTGGPSARFVALPGYAKRPDKASLPWPPIGQPGGPIAQATEGWWGVCSQDEQQCLTIATYSDLSLFASMNRRPNGTGYLTPVGFFNLHPGAHCAFSVYLFPYKYDAIVGGKTIRQRIYELHCTNGCC